MTQSERSRKPASETRGTAEAAAAQPPRWILLIHSIPPRPNYLRVKIGRRLQKLGAVAVKNSVYAMPRTEGARERTISTGRVERPMAMACLRLFTRG